MAPDHEVTERPLRLGRDRPRRPRGRAPFHVELLERRLLLSDLGLGLMTSLGGPGAATSLSPVRTFSLNGSQASPPAGSATVATETPSGWRIYTWAASGGNVAGARDGPAPSQDDLAAIGKMSQSTDVLLDAPLSRIDGTLGPNETIDLYQIPLDPQTVSLQISVTAGPVSSGLPGRLWLIDESGRVMSNWYMPEGTHDFTVNLEVQHQPLGGSIIFGLSHGNRPATDGSTADFNLTVSRQTTPSDSVLAPISTIVPLPPGLMMTTAGQAAETTELASASLSTQPAASAVSTGQSIGLSLVVVGPMPTRSAGSMGGWFADGETSPPIDLLEAALVDLRLIENQPQRHPVGAPSGQAADDAAEARGDARLVAFETSGGFPLLAAGLGSGSRRARSAASAVILPAIDKDGEVDELSAAASAIGGCHAAAPIGMMVGDPAGGGAHHDAPKRRGSFLVGLNIVATLAFGLLLPDLVAAFQSVQPGRPLPRGLRGKRGG